MTEHGKTGLICIKTEIIFIDGNIRITAMLMTFFLTQTKQV